MTKVIIVNRSVIGVAGRQQQVSRRGGASRGRGSGRGCGPLQELVQPAPRTALTFLFQPFVYLLRERARRAFWKKLSISGVHHSPRVDVRRRRFLYLLLSFL